MLRYFIVYKPYQVLSQFSSGEGKKNLKDFFSVPPDVYSIGRLDYDSEGLLILTNDKQLNHRLLNPQFKHEREYWIQVEGGMDAAAIQQLEAGVVINVDGQVYRTRKCKASIFAVAPNVSERNPPIRFRKNIPTTWIRIILTEGKNRQVRKMTSAVGYPTLRLMRVRIEKLNLQSLLPGEMRELSKEEIYAKLFSRHKT
jgi:23S rRNA pseudouridine2457 synthase